MFYEQPPEYVSIPPNQNSTMARAAGLKWLHALGKYKDKQPINAERLHFNDFVCTSYRVSNKRASLQGDIGAGECRVG